MDPRWMSHAWACFGVREYAGPRSNAAVVAMYKDAGHEAITDDAVPWCAAFVGACLVRSGVTATGSLRARSYLDWGIAIEQAAFGAVAILSRGSNPALGHVGFVVGATDDDVYLLGGNQANAVTVARFSRKRLLAFRMLREASEKPLPVAAPENAAVPPPPDAFEACLPHVLAMEGGFSDDPHDPGGPTNKGITLATWAKYKGVRLTGANRADLVESLKQISDADLRAIYRDRYWRPSRAGGLPVGIDLAHFDASVNHGVTGGAKLLQRTLGVSEDGIIGPITQGVAWSTPPGEVIARHGRYRERRYRALPHFWRFGRGWLRRTRATERAALTRAAEKTAGLGSNLQQATETQTASLQPKEDQSMTKPASSSTETKHWTKSLTLWGAFVTTMATVLPIVGPFFGLPVTADMIRELGEQGLKVLQAIATFAGVGMTVLGRLRANSRLHH
jgi:uncharacterized protein (TIGR02594 family)